MDMSTKDNNSNTNQYNPSLVATTFSRDEQDLDNNNKSIKL